MTAGHEAGPPPGRASSTAGGSPRAEDGELERAEWWHERFFNTVDCLDGCSADDARGQITKFMDALDDAFVSNELPTVLWVHLTFGCTSALINLGCDHADAQTIESGIHHARKALSLGLPVPIAQQLNYNIANGLHGLHAIDHRQHRQAPRQAVDGRRPCVLEDRTRLRESRALLHEAGHHPDNPPAARAMSLCNLGNNLDDAGRWVEAYQAYAEALLADPTNGNAAGNAAELLRRRIILRRGMDGHYAAVYKQYAQQAKQHRDRTVELAGEATALRWDRLITFNAVGHVEHAGDPLDDYQQWIKDRRLALTVAVEGLGSDEPRWDVAMVSSVSVDPGDPDPPLIFTSMNVLKAEYLTARRLAYQGERWLAEAPHAQHPSDTGGYVDTLDMSLYGEPSAMLILAQRATLDLLDKVAVAANDHFVVGLAPHKVDFRSFWLDERAGVVRDKIPVPQGRAGAAVALAALAHDLDEAGMYPRAQTLRNAGTHRLVRLTHGDATGVTKGAHSSVSAEHLIEAAHESLRVARAAYLYLIDLVADGEEQRTGGEVRLPLPIPSQR